MAETVDPKKLITLKHAADLFGHNAEHLRQVAVTGRLKVYQRNGVGDYDRGT